MKALSLLIAMLLICALYSCGGGGSEEEQPERSPRVDCDAKPEVCK